MRGRVGTTNIGRSNKTSGLQHMSAFACPRGLASVLHHPLLFLCPRISRAASPASLPRLLRTHNMATPSAGATPFASGSFPPPPRGLLPTAWPKNGARESESEPAEAREQGGGGGDSCATIPRPHAEQCSRCLPGLLSAVQTVWGPGEGGWGGGGGGCCFVGGPSEV